jgi:hypothetical protein
MYRGGFLFALLLTNLNSANAQVIEESYFCSAEFAGGISYDARSKSWQGTVFNPDRKFVLTVKVMGSRMEGSSPVDDLRVTVTASGSNFAAPCVDLRDPLKTITSKHSMIFCTVSFTDYTISRTTNRFLAVYPVGYVTGEDNNDDTPSVIGGTCTKIK